MLQVDSWIEQQRVARSPAKPLASRPDPMRDLLHAFRRNQRALGLWTLACLGLALAWLTVTTVEYSSSAVLVLDPRKPSSASQSETAVVPETSIRRRSRVRCRLRSPSRFCGSSSMRWD